MAWEIKITESARQDIRAVKQWYRSQSTQALKNFTEELSNKIESLKDGSVDYRAVYKDNRKLPLKKFPYFIFIAEWKTVNWLLSMLFFIISVKVIYSVAG